MKTRLASVFIVCALTIVLAACVDPAGTNPIAPPVTSGAIPDQAISVAGSVTATHETAPLSGPAYSPLPAAPIWQLCTWILYSPYTEPSVAKVGQPTRVWAFIYIEDFPATEVFTELLIDGVVVARQTLMITFDEAWPFHFDIVPDKPGVYNVTVRAIFAVNSVFTTLPGAESCYSEVSTSMIVQA